jgi:hypothetical protein
MTTNLELKKMGRLLGIKNLQVLMLDEILSLRSQLEGAKRQELNLIVNLNASDRNVNGHWTLAYVDSSQKIFYCPYGSSPPKQVVELLMGVDGRQILTSDIPTQQFGEDTCGERCVLILYLLGKRHRFEDIVLSFL